MYARRPLDHAGREARRARAHHRSTDIHAAVRSFVSVPLQENGLLDIAKDVHTSWEYMKGHHAALNREKQVDPSARLPDSISVTTTAHLMSVQRQKRCVLAYLNYRVDKIRDVWWDTGAALPEELRSVLSRQELTFLAGYDRLLTEYMSSSDLVLTGDQSPPKDLFVAVQAAKGKEVGEIMTTNGVVTLDQNSEVLIRRTDAELLIRQGQLVQSHKE
jgi:hypothetical protein